MLNPEITIYDIAFILSMITFVVGMRIGYVRGCKEGYSKGRRAARRIRQQHLN